MKLSILILTAVSYAGLGASQATAYSQCGGQNWTGDTTCILGWVCTYENDYYSQSSSPSSTTTTTLVTSVSNTASGSSSTSTSTSTSTTVTIPTSTNWATVDGLQFNIDGRTQYYAGSNSYWLPFLTNRSDVDHVLSDFYNSGLRIMRVWGFNDVNAVPTDGTVWFQLLENGEATINTGADGLQHLDYVVYSAAQHGVKLIINFVNNWDDFGGMNAYVTAFGGSKTEWYTDAASQAAYRNYIATLVARYKHTDAVFAWELANEPRCNGCDTSVITQWVADTSAYIKSLDPNHLVCIGDEGFGLDVDSDGSYPFSITEGLNFTANLAIDTIDFGTFHLYPDGWSVAESWGSSWVTAHGDACASVGKPCILEEYGVTSNKCAVEGPWQTTALATTGIAGDNFWQYGDTISTSAYSVGQSPDDGFTIYYGTSDYTCLVTDHVAAI